MNTKPCTGSASDTNHTRWKLHNLDNNLFWLSCYYYGGNGLLEEPLQYYYDSSESQYMLAVDDPEAA